MWCDSGTHDPREEADKVSAELRTAGLPAGVLFSSDYPSLNPGYWVTFSGVFDAEQRADQHRELLARAGFAGRVRLVSTRPVAPSTAEQPFWTAIVASTTSQGDAEAIAARLRGQGRPGAVLLSSRYSSLNPGYWVAYSGRFTDRAAADQQAQELRAIGYPGAYAREVRQ